jgi:hypothetical protein
MNEEPFFLSDMDIVHLTGYIQQSKQCDHLHSLGIPFFRDAKGRPRVPRNAFRLVAVPQRFRIIEGEIEYRVLYPLPPRPDSVDET